MHEDDLIVGIHAGMASDVTEQARSFAKTQRHALFQLLDPLIEAAAARYLQQAQRISLDTKDLRVLAHIGVDKALDHYQTESDYKFSVYALWWMRMEIHRALGLPSDNDW